jgi:hypothetical protein
MPKTDKATIIDRARELIGVGHDWDWESQMEKDFPGEDWREVLKSQGIIE